MKFSEFEKLPYEKMNWSIVENEFKRLRRAVAEAFDGTGENVDRIIEEYVARKNRIKKSLKSVRS